MNERLLDLNDVGGLLTLGAGGDIERYLLAFGQGLEPVTLQRGKVDENVLASAVGGNKAIAFLVAEPLDSSLCHLIYIFLFYLFGLKFLGYMEQKNRELSKVRGFEIIFV